MTKPQFQKSKSRDFIDYFVAQVVPEVSDAAISKRLEEDHA